MSHREWRHEVSEKWLMSRKACLTASDVKKLIPDFKRIEAGKIKLEQAQQFAKVYGEKRSFDMDPMSYGAMARGHVLEPHAVDEFNLSNMKRFTYFWWDDRLIMDDALGFSPDALDITQPPGTRFVSDPVIAEIAGANGQYRAPEHILEVKCYEAGAYYQRMAAAANGEPIDERWQVATAMVVCPTIEIADVMFYAPQCRSWFYEEYDQHDLSEEIEIVKKIKDYWKKFRKSMADAEKSCGMRTSKTEDEIYQAYLMDEMMD